MINRNIVTVKCIDPDGEFLVLEISDESNNTTEVFIDKQAFRFTSKRHQSAILNKMIETVFITRNESEDSSAKVTVSVVEDSEWNKKITEESNKGKFKLSSPFTKELGVINSSSDQGKLKDFLNSINVRVND